MAFSEKIKTKTVPQKGIVMLFSKNEAPKQKKKSAAPTLVLWGLASLGAYAVVSTVKKKSRCMMDSMKKWVQDKPDTPHGHNTEFL